MSEKPIGQVIEEFAELRSHLDSERKKFKELEEQLKRDMMILEQTILAYQRDQNLTSTSTGGFTAFQTTKKYVRISSWDTFINFVIKTKNTQCLEKRCGKLACIELFESEEGIVPDDIGLSYESEIAIQVRKQSK